MTTTLNEQTLGRWLVEHQLADSPAITVEVLTGGQSNPTFRVNCDRGNYVLRKKPPGQLLASAHAIDREFRVMKALAGSAVPVPRMLAWCDDAALVGTPFYLMEFLAGRVFSDQSLPGLQPAERGLIYLEMNRVIADLHAVDYEVVGLGDFGRPGNYVGRQIARWTRQCEATTIALPAALKRLMDWLPQYVPSSEETSIVHGDYRLDNLVFHPNEARVIGVLDWELSTLGDPLADISYHCMSWRIPASLWRGVGGLDLAALGIPCEQDYLRRYTETTGRDAGAQWEFYMAYNLFRMAAILHGIAQRAADGNATAENALETGRIAEPLANIAWDCALRHQAATR
jgi:acyl-CoA dehydrogenase